MAAMVSWTCNRRHNVRLRRVFELNCGAEKPIVRANGRCARRPARRKNWRRTMTRDEIMALFARRENDWRQHNAAALVADHAPDGVVVSPTGVT